MLLQVGTTATGHGVIFEAKKGQNLTLHEAWHEGGKCSQSIHVAVHASAGTVVVAVVAAAAATCMRIDPT